nr:hypothetical protein BaRGS_035370 [Batillaria attramentaria]
MEDDEDSGVVRYRRRLDRTPEKEFERLPDTEKKLLSRPVLGEAAARNPRRKFEGHSLSDKLMLSGQELEALKLQITAELPDDGTFDGQAAKKLAEYMEQVKTAEEKREKAMEARLRQAEEDRDEALHSLARSRQQAASYKKDEAMERDRDRNRREATEDTQYRKASVYQRPGKHLDMSDSSSEFESDEEEFLMREKTGVKGQSSRHDNTEGSSSDTDRRGAKLLREVERRQQREREMYQEELQVVLEQRDQAVEQLRREREKQQLQQIRMPGQREQMLMAKITVLQREKDKAYAMVHQLQEEQYDINLLSSLHKALFSDSAVNEASTVYAHEGKLNSKLAEEDEIARPNLKEDNQLLEQLRQASQQNSVLMQRCEELEAECTREKEEKNKLERLNGVLRKKLITFSTGSGQVEEE